MPEEKREQIMVVLIGNPKENPNSDFYVQVETSMITIGKFFDLPDGYSSDSFDQVFGFLSARIASYVTPDLIFQLLGRK